ncbi:hypothetical protein [Paenibacillus sp. RC67]|uniref:hypothetical protein n=1 Tax=Paenibacillus sp. RC67 TaxID=3039392 RepID=UPI0024ADA168|nr:hypothetical protein [Paenibacillus sp. RC67]
MKLSWIYDVEPIIDKILRNNNEKAYRINYYKETQTIEIKMVTREFISSHFDLQSKAEYILPVSINKESNKFSLPMSYHVLCCILLELYLSQNNKDESFLDWPTLKVEASYEDVSGNKYKRSMNLKPKVIDVKKIKNDMEPCARGWFEVSL